MMLKKHLEEKMKEMIYNKLTNKEKEIISNIEKKAEKRKHKKKYNVDFIISYMLETFKDFNYTEREDALDMLDAIFIIAEKCEVMTDKAITKERKYMIKEYVDNQFEDENEETND